MRFCSIIGLLTLTVVFSLTGQAQNPSDRSADSMARVLASLPERINDTTRVNLLNRIVISAVSSGNYDLATSRALENLKYLKLMQDTDIVWRGRAASMAIFNLGLSRNRKGDYSGALEHFKNALKINQVLNDKKEIARSAGYAGVMNDYLGNYPDAIQYYFKALRADEETGNLDRAEAWLGNIGTVYFMQKDYENALEYYGRALKLSEASIAKTYKSVWLENMGNIYQEIGQTDAAMDRYIKSLEEKKKAGNAAEIGKTLANIAVLYHKKKEEENAILYTEEALAYQRKAGDLMGIATDLGNLGSLYYNRAFLNPGGKNAARDFKKAEEFLNEGLIVASRIGMKSQIMEVHFTFHELCTATGRYHEALKHFKKYAAIKDSLLNEESVKKQTKIEMNFQFEKKEAIARAGQEKKDSLAKEEKKRQVVIRNIFIVGFGFALLLAVTIYRGYRSKRRANFIISAQKSEVEEAKAIIEEQKKTVEEKQAEILDSIHYARRIQGAMMTQEKYIEKNLARFRKL